MTWSSLLVTCPGAYADSGLGTGGCVLLHEGGAHVVDRQDSTGQWESNGLLYRFARGLGALIGIDPGGVRVVLKLPDARDVHDVAVRNDEVVCVCSGTNELLWFDLHGRPTRRWAAPGEGDAWHLNSLCFVNGRLYLCAFGEFATHRAWAEGCKGTGFVFDHENGERPLTGLSGPHSPRFIDGAWHVCDSHSQSVLRQRPGGSLERTQLAAFTRGIAFDDQYLYVGESADRKAATADATATVAVLERTDLKVVERLPVPFSEIYELQVVPRVWADSIARESERYALDQGSDRVEVLEGQVRRGQDEVLALRAEMRHQRESLGGRVAARIRRLGRSWLD